MIRPRRHIKKKLFTIILIPFLALITYFFTLQPSNTGDWNVPQKVLPSATFNEKTVTIKNIRNFHYLSEKKYTPAYYTKTYDLSRLRSVDYVLSPFSDKKGPAHVFLSFCFGPNDHVAISVEARRKNNSKYSIVKGMLRQYTVIYIVADEKDVIKLRSNYQKDKVYIYPLKLPQDQVRELFVDMLKKTNQLTADPEFYNTLTHSCSTILVDHLNRVLSKKITPSYKVILPAYSDELFYSKGLINTRISLMEAQKNYLINGRAEKYADAADFSERIRSLK